MDALSRLLEGAVDLHVHTAPSLFPRRIDHVEAARQAAKAGMRAIVVKSHHHSTSPDLVTLNNHVLRELPVQVFGCVALNGYLGGLNPYVVDMTLRMGGKVVWFPTISAENHIRHFEAHAGINFPAQEHRALPEAPVRVLDNGGNPLPAARQILGLIAEADAVMSPGHVSAEEALVLVEAAREAGVRRVIVNHPEFLLDASEVQQREFVRLGAFIERSISQYLPGEPCCEWPLEDLLRWIDLVGPERTVLGSDLGQKQNPPPMDGFRTMIGLLLDRGIRESDIELMIKKNGSWLLGLSD